MLRTRICELFGIRHPVMQAGMANYAGPELVAAVSNAGGLGILGAVDRDVDALERDIAAIRARTSRPFGVNLVLATPSKEKLALLLQQRVPVIATSWGDPTAVIAQVREHGLRSLHQVQTEVEAAHVAAAGVDVQIAHAGWTTGGLAGAGASAMSLPQAAEHCQAIFEVTRQENPDTILLAHGGPYDVPGNVTKLYEMTDAVGFVGASSIERIPIERAVMEAVSSFKSAPLPRLQKVGAAV